LDIDCGDIPDAKTPVRVTGNDPYALDRDKDGSGCEVGGGGAQSPVGVGDTLTVVDWSPASAEGSKYELCASRGSQADMRVGETFGVWKVKAGERSGSAFKVTLRVGEKNRAPDIVPLR
jgi:hypothetical protein